MEKSWDFFCQWKKIRFWKVHKRKWECVWQKPGWFRYLQTVFLGVFLSFFIKNELWHCFEKMFNNPFVNPISNMIQIFAHQSILYEPEFGTDYAPPPQIFRPSTTPGLMFNGFGKLSAFLEMIQKLDLGQCILRS